MQPVISKKILSANVLMTGIIVLLHTVFDEPRLRGVYVLCQVAVPVFFTISAYLYFQRWELSWKCYRQKIQRRLKSLWLPFVLFNALIVVYYYVKLYLLPIPSERQLLLGGLETLCSCLFGVPQVMNGPLWFVRELMVFILLAPLLGWVVLWGWRSTLVIVLASFVACRFASYFSLFYWLPCLAFGCYCALHEESIIGLLDRIRKWTYSKPTVIVCFLCFIAVAYSCLQEAEDSSLFYYAFRMSAPVWTVLIYSLCDNLLPRWLVGQVAPLTFFIFCSHTFFINIVSTLLSRFLPMLPCGLSHLVVFAVSFTLVVLMGKVLSHIRPLWLLLSGFRGK